MGSIVNLRKAKVSMGIWEDISLLIVDCQLDYLGDTPSMKHRCDEYTHFRLAKKIKKFSLLEISISFNVVFS